LNKTHKRGLDQITLDGDLKPEPGQDVRQKLDAQRAAMVGPGTARKAQGEVIVLDVLAAKGINRGEMAAETDAQIEISAAPATACRMDFGKGVARIRSLNCRLTASS
jgi:hypothetical protein